MYSDAAERLFRGVTFNLPDMVQYTSHEKNLTQSDFDEALHIATESEYDNLQMIDLLIKLAANANSKDDRQNTPLHITAREGGQIAVVELLIKNGADVNAKNEFEFTPLHFAAEKEHENITEFLIKSGADINAKNKLSGNTALHLAKHEKIAKLLVENGADINAKSQQGFTPLHIATFGGKVETLQMLIENGADRNILDNYGRTALNWAELRSDDEQRRMMIDILKVNS